MAEPSERRGPVPEKKGRAVLLVKNRRVPVQAAKRRSPRRDGVETREALLAAAAEEFAEKGYELASAREICRRAGVNSALLSRYFGSKEAMYRIVAKRLFGDLGAPLAALADGVADDASWRTAVREWIDDMLFMTIPTERAQKLCATLFRHEVTRPTKFHREFKEAFGRPVFDGLKKLFAMKVKDEEKLDLWTSAIWAQVSVYALADRKWHDSFKPSGANAREWADKVASHICETLFKEMEG